MNTIPSIGPDSAIAPRTGSGSPQTTPQQRTDAAPPVLSDSAAIIADPGVMLKITPPVTSRFANVDIPTHQLPGEVAKALADLQAVEGEMIKALIGSAADADQAVASRLKEAIEALPLDVQEAIRKATSPEMARLLKLAAMTEPGIKEAPAYIRTGNAPLAQDAAEAASRLLLAIRQAPAFQLAGAVRAALELVHGNQDPSVRIAQQANAQLEQAANRPGAAEQSSPLSSAFESLEALLPEVISGRTVPPGLVNESRLATQQHEESAAAQPLQSPESELAEPNLDSLPNEFRAWSASQASDELATTANPTAPKNPPTLASELRQLAAPAGMLISAPQVEEGLRDALRLLMDGRMIWHGQFTPDRPMSLERSDAWRANARALGGMEKGTSLRIRFDLPNLGAVEIRALGFGGQVSVRVHAQSAATSTFAQALPALQSRLRERGVAGAQVVVEPI